MMQKFEDIRAIKEKTGLLDSEDMAAALGIKISTFRGTELPLIRPYAIKAGKVLLFHPKALTKLKELKENKIIANIQQQLDEVGELMSATA